MTVFTATHPEAVIPFIPAGTVAHTVSRFLNGTQQAICAAMRDEAAARDVCPTYANCVLDQLAPFTQSGLGVGTTLLTLISAALSLLPAAHINAYTLWKATRARKVLLLALLVLGGFSGYLQAGKGLQALRKAVESDEGWFATDHIHEDGTSKARKDAKEMSSLKVEISVWERRPPVPRKMPYWTTILLTVAIIFSCTIVYASVIIGFLGVVTWACDRQPLSLSWTLPKTAPVLLEAVLLRIARWRIKNATRKVRIAEQSHDSDDMNIEMQLPHGQPMDNERDGRQNLIVEARDTTITTRNRQLASELKIAEILCVGLEGAIVLWGTAVLGSMILIDGIPSMIFLLLIPALYAATQLCLSEVVRSIQ